MEKMSPVLQRSLYIVGTSVVLGFLFNYLVWDKAPGIGLSLYVLLLIATFLGIALLTKKPIKGDLFWLFPLLLVFAGFVAVRANELLTVLNIFGSMLLMLLIIQVYVRGTIRSFIPTDYLKIPLLPLKWVDPLIQSCADTLSLRQKVSEQKRAAEIMRGIFITIPVIVLFAILFSSADPIFGGFFSNFLELNISPDIIGRGIVIFIVSLVLIAGYSYAFTAKADEPATHERNRHLGTIEGTILFGSINALFLAFILVQITYLFGGESNIIGQGLNYAEYARRGFFELLAVAMFSYLILLGAEAFIKQDTNQHSRLFKILSSAMVLQVAAIMTSSFYRLSLYEQAFGFTTLRLYSHAFILFLAVVFAFLLYKILTDHRENTFAFRTFLAIVAFVLCMNIFNPDAFIAQKNLERYAATGKIDTEYLSELSADATGTLLQVLDTKESEARSQIQDAFYNDLTIRQDGEPWQSWNLSRAQSLKLLTERRAELTKPYMPIPAESAVQ